PTIKAVYMPTNRIVIATNLQGAQLEPLMKLNGKTAALSADTLAAIHSIEKNPIWGVVVMDGKLRSTMEAEIAKDPPPAELKPLVDGALKANRMTFYGKLEGTRLSLNLSLICLDANAASQLVSQMQTAWNQAKQELAKLDMMLAIFPKAKQAINDL